MPRVLVVEDDVQVAASLLRLIENAGAQSVAWAREPAVAYELAAEQHYDIVVADQDLGRDAESGLDVLAGIDTEVRVLYSGTRREVPASVVFVHKPDCDVILDLVRGWEETAGRP